MRIDPEVCAGFGICTGISAEVFELHEYGDATVLIGEVPTELQDLVRRSVSQCPAPAISMSEDSGD